MANRRTVLKAGAAGFLTSLVSSWSHGQTVPSVLSALRKKQFTDLLPNPLDPANLFAPDAPGGTSYTLVIREFSAPLGLVDSTGKALYTALWGYGTTRQAPSYPGRTFNLRRGGRYPFAIRTP